MHLGYELGRARAEQARLREVKRVIELEVASYHTPQRVEVVSRTLLGMEPPSADRIIALSVREPPPKPEADGSELLIPGRPSVLANKGGVAPLPRAGASSAPAPTELLLPKITPPKSHASPPDAQGTEPAAP